MRNRVESTPFSRRKGLEMTEFGNAFFTLQLNYQGHVSADYVPAA